VAVIVIFNNLASIPATFFRCPVDDDGRAKLALEIDQVMRERAPAGWNGDEMPLQLSAYDRH
jgi:type I restriction enzyme R subunit